MNSSQLTNIVTTILQPLLGLLIARGFISGSESESIGGGIAALVVFLVSHNWHASPPASGGPSASSSGKVSAVLLFAALSLALGSGCASLDPNARPVVVRAEQAESLGNAAFDAVVHIDNSNRAFFKTNLPPLHAFCEWLREPVVIAPLTTPFPRGLALVRSADAVKESYKTTGSTNDYAILNSSLAALETATSQAQQLIATATALKH